MKVRITKPQTLRLNDTRIIIGLNNGVPIYAVTSPMGERLFSAIIEAKTPDEIIQIAIAMREALKASE